MTKLSVADLSIYTGERWRMFQSICDEVAEKLSLTCQPEISGLALITSNHAHALGVLVWARKRRIPVAVIAEQLCTDDAVGQLAERGYTVLRDVSSSLLMRTAPARCSFLDEGALPEVAVLTSGTTGDPKFVAYSWNRLIESFSPKRPDALTWLMTFHAGTFAWYQVVSFFMSGRTRRLAVPQGQTAYEVFCEGGAAEVTAISSTATFWKLLLLSVRPDDLASLQLRQITLGGEQADAATLERLRAYFPQARITHTYASSEAGLILVSHDGQPGYSLDAIEAAKERGIDIKVENGCVWFRRASVEDSWKPTGDYAEEAAGRLLIRGRAPDRVANVGGTKVSLRVLEEFLQSVPGVLKATLRSAENALVGQILEAALVVSKEREHQCDEEIIGELHKLIRSRYAAPAFVPRRWHVYRRLESGGNFKDRGEGFWP